MLGTVACTGGATWLGDAVGSAANAGFKPSAIPIAAPQAAAASLKLIFCPPIDYRCQLPIRFSPLRSWDHAAFEQLVGDRRRYSIDEHRAHLWIVTQKIYGFLLPLRFRLFSFLPQLLARRILIFLDDFVGSLVQQRVLAVLSVGYSRQQQHRKPAEEGHGYSTQHRFCVQHECLL